MRLDFSKGKVLVVGDLMLDRYFFGAVSRISPEAPVPVVKVNRQSSTLGGAGNVANNLARLETRVCVVGPLGRDENGDLVRRTSRENNIDLCALPVRHPTISKTRVIGEHQQIARIDVETPFAWNDRLLKTAKRVISAKIKGAGVVVISDYGKGFCSGALCAFIIGAARKKGAAVIVDPKGHEWKKYAGADIVTPNVKELSDIAGRAVENQDQQIAAAAGTVRKKYRLGSLLVTRSEKGMSLFGAGTSEHFPTQAREVFDVSGAGDTVVATLAAALAARYALHDAVLLANKAAGIVVGKVGTAPVTINELRAEFDNSFNPKLLTNDLLVEQCVRQRSLGKKIVFTNGCFDIVHRGHVHLLREAKRHGDLLVVAVNSDRSQQKRKGTGLPVNTERDRAHIIAAIDAVDYVTIFNEETPIKLIRQIRPDVIVKGGNYNRNRVLGREFAGKTVIIPLLEGYSTEEISRKICIKP